MASSSRDRRILTRVNVSDPGDEIVISGIAGRFPNSANVAEFSYNLYNSIDMVNDDERRWKHLNEEIPKRYGKTVNLEKFDATFFSIHYRQANNMDPQVRILQEHAYEAIIDAGVAPKSLRGSRTGVFIGCCVTEVDEYFLYGLSVKDGLGLVGASRALLANRISFAMDFKGPSLTIDTACSSSGYALDLAFNALRNGECDAAIVGGANLLLTPATTLQFFRLGVLSKDGYCRPFDKDASGYCRSEAINVLFLQKKKDAKRVYADLIYSKTNVDGFKNEGLTYPSGRIQIQLLEEFYKDIAIDPTTIDYVESHSTGTKVGDPEECFTLDSIFCTGRAKPLPVGSVKSNMGHAEASSLICSIVKALLVFENKKIPPNIHYKSPRPGIPSLEAGRLQVVSETQAFNGALISVNSFGFGGANAHSLLRGNTKEKVNRGIPSDRLPRLVLWSGRTEEAVTAVLDSVCAQPLDAEFVALLQNVQTATPASNTYRGYGLFTQSIESENATCIAHHIDNFASSKRPIVFVYSGMGSQWCEMGADLMKIPLFAAAIDKCHDILAAKQLDLKRIITSAEPKMFDNILHSFVGIAAIQIGLTDILRAIGLEPDYIIGHSMGELGCAYADGCITDEEMILAAYSRGMASLETKVVHGSMAAVGVGYKQLKDMLVDGVEIACHNSSDSCTISGPADLIAAFVGKLKKENYFAKEVQCSNIPYHSSYIADMGAKLLARLERVIERPKERSTRWISSSVPKSRWESVESRFSSASYHTNNLLSPVLYEEASENLPKDALTIEVAPHGLLQAILKRSFPDGLHFSITKRGHPENSLFLINSLGRIFENGVDMDVSKLYPAIEFPVSCGTPMISSLIKWDHSENWFVPRYDDKQHNEMLVTVSLKDPEFEFISGHEIDGRVLFPATGYLFLAWRLALLQNKQLFAAFDVEFEDVKFLRACTVPADASGVELTVVIQRGTGRFEIIEGKNAVVTGIVRPAADTKLTQLDNSEPDESVTELTKRDFYKELRLRGYHYKNLFKSVVSARADGSSSRIEWHSNWIAFLDCLLQLQIIGKDTRSLALPTGLRKLVIKTGEHLRFISEANGEPLTANYCATLNVLRCGGVEIRGLQAQVVGRRPPPGIPVLESYQFVPHFPTPALTRLDTARFCVQLALENLRVTKVSAIEIDTGDGREPLSEFFGVALGDLPLVTAELSYLSSRELEIPYTQVTSEKLSSFTNCTFVIRSECLFDDAFMESIVSQLGECGFILSREPCEEKISQMYGLAQGFTTVAVISHAKETLVLIQYNKVKPKVPSNIIKITNDDCSWLERLKEVSKSEPTIAFAENEPLSGMLGLVNCIRKEPGGGSNLRCVFIDDESAPPFEPESAFYKYQLEKNLAVNVYRKGEWGSYRHLTVAPTYERAPQEAACYANSLTRGDLSSIKWLRSPLADLSRGDLVRIQYASLNFRDVMLATGKLSADTIVNGRFELACVMGLEFAGVSGDGRRVMGLKYAGALATHTQADDVLLWDVPDNWTLEEAATVPCVYATVYAAFFLTTRIRAGKSILIHAGSGGVGLAAIHVAFAYGMEVFTTVSTEEKRNFLLSEFPQLKRENIGNSRDISFEELVMKRTRGRGVDYVLNSLADEKLLASVRCLGNGGKFLEIGKFDIVNDNKLGLSDFLRGLTFYAFFVDKLFKTTIEKKMELKELLDADIKRGIIKPLRTNVFKADEIEQAFRLLASGKHIGKVVLQMRENENDRATVPIAVLPRVYCHPSLSYIICGGLGGFGLELADWLVLRGCNYLILSSSRGVTKSYQRMRIKIWESYGVRVIVSTADITTREGCNKLVTDAIKLAPVGGIFNLAVKLRDGILENQDAATFGECMAPKALATQHLDEIARSRCPLLQHFVVFSSVSCGRGNAGQANYGMANSVMERICEKRVRAGEPGKAIQWGAVGEVGIVADMQEDNLDMEIGGTLQQRISSCLEELDTLLSVPDAVVSSMVVAEKRYTGGAKGGIIEMIMNIMSIKDVKSLSLETKLSELGMDSLMTVEISQALEREFNITLTPVELRSITLLQLKAYEGDESVLVPEKNLAGLGFLLRNIGSEANSNDAILKLESLMDAGYTKALIIPGIEGTGGEIYYNLARSLKYPTYLLQIASCWQANDLNEMYTAIIDDVLKLYENETTFLIVGYSFGAMLALKLAKTLESLGVTGKVILIDGAPEFLQRFFVEQMPADVGRDEFIQALVFELALKFASPNESSERLGKILANAGWEAKLACVDSLYEKFPLYSKEFVMKSLNALYRRMLMVTTLDLKSFERLSTPITLVKPSEISFHAIDADYGLRAYAESEIDIRTIEGNHSSILENDDLPVLINDAF